MFCAWCFYKPITIIKLIIQFYQFRPKVVNLHFPDHQLFECYILMCLFRFKLIISLHGDEVERLNRLSKISIRYYFYNKLFSSSICITGCSNYLLNQFKRKFNDIDSDKCYPMYNGVSEIFINQRIINNKKQHITCITRFVPKKGIDLFFKATTEVNSHKLLLAGGDQDELLQLGLKKGRKVVLMGRLESDEIAKYLSRCHINILPSKKEPYGILVAEALCCGSPIIATNVGGIPEVINLAKLNLSKDEKKVFDNWVLIVQPNVDSIKNGIKNILKNNNDDIKNYLSLVPKFRSIYYWPERLRHFHSVLDRV